mgnify:CR=1 FL=1
MKENKKYVNMLQQVDLVTISEDIENDKLKTLEDNENILSKIQNLF